MTHCMEMIIELNKHTSFKTMKCNYTAQGIEATLIDTRDGQVYRIEVKPAGQTLCLEAIIKTCPICGKDVLIEDLYECDKCGKSVCSDCIVNASVNNEDINYQCKNCISPDPFEEGR